MTDRAIDGIVGDMRRKFLHINSGGVVEAVCIGTWIEWLERYSLEARTAELRTHWGFKLQDRCRAGVWRHHRCYRSRNAMERGLAHLQAQSDGEWSDWSGPNYQGEKLRHKLEYRTRELTEFPEEEASELQSLRAELAKAEAEVVRVREAVGAFNEVLNVGIGRDCPHDLPVFLNMRRQFNALFPQEQEASDG